MRHARRFRVSGRVQGVGFRAFVADVARADGLDGWVRNLPDGQVEVLAEGEHDALQRLERHLSRGPRLARVDDVTSEDVPPDGTGGFRIA